MSLVQHVLSAAPHHARLLASIAETDYANPALEQQTGYIEDLQSELAKCEKAITWLEQKTKKERVEHEHMRDSNVRKLAHKIVGQGEKFKAKASKEEREYLEALQREIEEKQRRDKLKSDLAEADRIKSQLIEVARRNELDQAELKQLYESIFQGPTPDAPEEDVLERRVAAAQDEYARAQSILNTEAQAAGILSDAEQAMRGCLANMSEALSSSQADIWGFGGPRMADVMERSSLNMAQNQARQVEMMVNQARRIQPVIKPIGRLEVAQGGLMDVYFDNIFSDLAFHDKIQDSTRSLRQSHEQLQYELQVASARAESAGQAAIGASTRLNGLRSELDAYRRQTFQSILATGGASPPTYAPPQGPPPPAMPNGPHAPSGFDGPPSFPSSPSSSTSDAALDGRGGLEAFQRALHAPPMPSSSDAASEAPLAMPTFPQPQHAAPASWGSRKSLAWVDRRMLTSLCGSQSLCSLVGEQGRGSL
ncbi:hypothetical protein PUNSTDRAFT_72180 [Punctularia strigosozonata HHB-11173 SS5]|uniref:uncharacterized protein n=1 Tax=Punctularia strigosozonata (strain HHB-11173) TaxID=741275 RepID=UPI000441831F|nr:uncharacterized protein PUNSTDRAFT_72180 [Punctularia strigosozonata HHB-11173 SS5]EIN06570.1 hypothetical protein PUNSTDRAFT_72180 [Punctularia strigosozonata HHB-11173 SS5]